METNLWAAVIKQAERDLFAGSERKVLSAAKYFFLKSRKNEIGNIRTFFGLCSFYEIDPDLMAKKIFEKLNVKQQNRVRRILKENGCV